MLDYRSYKSGEKPQSLVIFLHGYNGNLEDHQYAVNWLQQKINSAYIVTPQAPQICDKNPQKRQWFGMMKYDPEGKRRLLQTTTSEIFHIYSLASAEINDNSVMLNQFIDEMQKKYGIANENTYLIGFSQGAMLALYVALNRKNTLAGAFILSGMAAASENLEKNINSRPPLYLFHGENDLKVQYKTLDTTYNWLKKQQCSVKVYAYQNLDHRIIEAEIDEIAKIINDKLV